MDKFELEHAKKWLATVPFKNSNNEVFLREKDSVFHPDHMEEDDVKCNLELKYPGGVKEFKKDLAMDTVKDFVGSV